MFGDPFVANGEVAILPRADASPLDVLEIAIVEYVGSVFIRLVDGRMFATIGENASPVPTLYMPCQPRTPIARRYTRKI